MSNTLTYFDIGAVSVSLSVLFIYHVNLYLINPRCFGTKVPYGVNLKNAAMWIKKHKDMNDTATAILAVHTLRNTTMAAVFIGGNAIIVAYNIANSYDPEDSARKQLRSLIIMAFMFASFICWAHVARLCSVLSYMIGTMQYSEKLRDEAYLNESSAAKAAKRAKELEELALIDPPNTSTNNINTTTTSNPTFVTAVKAVPRRSLQAFKHKFEEFEKSGDYRIQKFESSQIPKVFEQGSQLMGMMTIYFSCGFRLMFAAIPFAFYIAGPLALVIATTGLLFMLRSYDYMRRVRGENEEGVDENTPPNETFIV